MDRIEMGSFCRETNCDRVAFVARQIVTATRILCIQNTTVDSFGYRNNTPHGETDIHVLVSSHDSQNKNDRIVVRFLSVSLRWLRMPLAMSGRVL